MNFSFRKIDHLSYKSFCGKTKSKKNTSQVLILFHLLMLMKLDKLECNEKKYQLLLSNVYFHSNVALLDLCDLYVQCGR